MKQQDYFLVYPYLEGKSEANTSVLSAWGAGMRGWGGVGDGMDSAPPSLVHLCPEQPWKG